jgi:hypothetical protein
MNLFYTWGANLGPFIAGAVYDRTQSYELVFTGITISLLISTAMTALLIKTRRQELQQESDDSVRQQLYLPTNTAINC